ncbi:MAG TPA: hypothetical protein VFW75_06010 [Acetobacteraceae bacterium]|nr:hypothetical protein [Acetobacteraceae bacterium]
MTTIGRQPMHAACLAEIEQRGLGERYKTPQGRLMEERHASD